MRIDTYAKRTKARGADNRLFSGTAELCKSAGSCSGFYAVSTFARRTAFTYYITAGLALAVATKMPLPSALHSSKADQARHRAALRSQLEDGAGHRRSVPVSCYRMLKAKERQPLHLVVPCQLLKLLNSLIYYEGRHAFKQDHDSPYCISK